MSASLALARGDGVFFFPAAQVIKSRANRLNIVGSYMLRPFGHPFGMLFRVVELVLLGILEQSLQPAVKRLTTCKRSQKLPTLLTQHCWPNNRELKQLRRPPQWRLQKNSRFIDQNNSSARASRFLVHFFDVHCTTTTWNLLIGRFIEGVNIRRRISLPLFEPE